MSNTQNTTNIQTFSFDNIPVRGKLIRLSGLEEAVPTISQAGEFGRKALSELLTASAVMQADLQEGSNITMQVQSDGDIALLMAKCSAKGELSALARTSDGGEVKGVDFNTITNTSSMFAVTVDIPATQHHYQSIIPFSGNSIGQSVEDYFTQSVQTPTYFKVFIGEVDGKLSCAALFLQIMPESDNIEDTQTPEMQDNWKRLGMILGTIKPEEILPGKLTEQELLFRLFVEDTVRVFEPSALKFNVPNARLRMEQAIKSLGKPTCEELLQEGPIKIMCELSGKEHEFTAEDIEKIFAD